MTGFQAEKDLVRGLHAAIAGATPATVAEALAPHVASDWQWRGVHPFHERVGPEAVAEAFWAPLLSAMTRLRRRPDIVMAGLNDRDGGRTTWVASMGHLLGLLDRPWLGIRPTGRIAMLRYAEFDRIEGGRIAETAMFVDIPHLMAQAGRDPFPPQTGAHLVQPGPLTHEGVMWGPQDPAEGEATLRAILRMMGDMEGRGDGQGSGAATGDYAAELARSWCDDMVWWGPHGIGATMTIPGYVRQHAGPFDAAFRGQTHYHRDRCLVAEGRFGGFFGWGNMTLRNKGGFMGMTGHAEAVPMTAVDLYRREGDRLAENWIFIDLLDWLARQGLDVLARMESVQPWSKALP